MMNSFSKHNRFYGSMIITSKGLSTLTISDVTTDNSVGNYSDVDTYVWAS